MCRTEITPYVFTTLRWDEHLRGAVANTNASGVVSSTYLVQYHLDRLREAAAVVFDKHGADSQSHFDRVNAVSFAEKLDGIAKSCKHQHGCGEKKALRIRLQYDARGIESTTAMAIPGLPSNVLFPQALTAEYDRGEIIWKVFVDSNFTKASTGTRFKTNDRDAYNRARQAAGILSFSDTAEVLLCDETGKIMDASITTPYFHRHGEWVTPATRFGGQQGVTRRWAIQQGLCREAEISNGSLQQGELLWLSNAVRGFIPAVLHIGQH